MAADNQVPKVNFLRHIIENDIEQNTYGGRVVTRFPPEPNGYLHVGHAKAICLNFGLARDFSGACHLRMDDTNPLTEDPEYVASIQEDIRWLGFDWRENMFYASDYFEKIFAAAIELIKKDLAYVCDLTPEQMRSYRGTLTEPGKNSPGRSRSIDENLDLFTRMRKGEFDDGKYTLRAKIDMASPNINMRDPALYRIRKAHHHRQGDAWCIYPLYDFTHPISDALEGITHSICTLEFEDHKPLYDWVCDNVTLPYRPRQYEFARLNLDYTVMSKRRLLELVEGAFVSGWDDPRMPTIQGMRRRGFTPAALRDFCERIGVTRKESIIALSTLEASVRDDLDRHSKRAMVVIDPIRVVIENYPEGQVEEFEVSNHPKDESMGKRKVKFAREVLIDRDDFMENPPSDFHRLKPGGEVRLRQAYVIRCEKVICDSAGKVTELRCVYDAGSKGGKTSDGRKVKGIIHWVAEKHSLPLEVRLYDRLFTAENPQGDANKDYKEFLNPKSLVITTEARGEMSLQTARKEESFQFERIGFFCADRHDFSEKKLVFNRTVELKDRYTKT